VLRYNFGKLAARIIVAAGLSVCVALEAGTATTIFMVWLYLILEGCLYMLWLISVGLILALGHRPLETKSSFERLNQVVKASMQSRS